MSSRHDKSSLLSFFRRDDGVSMIQFAILAPVFIIALISGLQIGIVLIIENALEGAAREASRFAIVDASDNGSGNIVDRVSETARDLSGGIINPDNIIIEVRAYENISELGRPEPFTDSNGNGDYDIGEVYDDINGNGQWDEDRGISGSFGKPGAAVIYKISYVYDTLIPIFNLNRLVTITAKTVVVNEDFTDSALAS